MARANLRLIAPSLTSGGAGGKHDAERGALVWFAVQADVAVVLLHDSARDWQAQAGAVVLGREKRLEQVAQVFGRAIPVSAIVMRGCGRQWVSGGVAFAGAVRTISVATVSEPFMPIASTAFRNRFTKACSS